MDPFEHARALREFMLNYNKIVDGCFSHCVFSFNSRNLTKDEETCIDNCTKRSLKANTRLSRGFADIQVKKMEEGMKENQKLLDAQQNIETTTTVIDPLVK